MKKFTEHRLNKTKKIQVNNFPTDMKWISVSDFLPAHASNVLVCGNGQHEITFYSNRTEKMEC